MKTTSLLIAPVLGLALCFSTVRAEDPAPTTVAPDVQALISALSKMAPGSIIKNEPAKTEDGKAAAGKSDPAKSDPTPDFQALIGTLLKLAGGATAKDGQGQGQAPDLQEVFGQLLKAATATPPAAAGADAKNDQSKQLETQIEMQLLDLLKAIVKMVPDDATAPDSVAGAGKAVPESKAAAVPPATPKAPLATGGLTTGGLTPSSSVNGRGPAAGIPRLNDSEWRQLFPAKEDHR